MESCRTKNLKTLKACLVLLKLILLSQKHIVGGVLFQKYTKCMPALRTESDMSSKSDSENLKLRGEGFILTLSK